MGDLPILEAAYQPDADTERWLKQLTEQVLPVCPAVGILAFTVDTRTPDAEVDCPVLVGDIPDEALEFTHFLHKAFPPQALSRNYSAPSCSHLSEFVDDPEMAPEWALEQLSWLRDIARQQDGWRLVAGNPNGQAIVLAGALSENTPAPSSAERWRWERVAAHIAAAFRLRLKRRGQSLDDAAAIFDSNGKQQHLREGAQDDCAALGEALGQFQRSRARGVSGEEALQLWTALLNGRWSFVQHADSDGRQLLVAYENEVHLQEPRALGRRERQVVEYAAHGHANKLIAYELGLSEPTVGTHLHRALKKLGLSNRTELIRARQAVVRAACLSWQGASEPSSDS